MDPTKSQTIVVVAAMYSVLFPLSRAVFLNVLLKIPPSGELIGKQMTKPRQTGTAHPVQCDYVGFSTGNGE